MPTGCPFLFYLMKNITLLDGTTWDVAELEAKMLDDDFYYGYLGKAALSSSSAKDLVDSPKTYHNYREYGSETNTPALLKGRMLHHMVLEPERYHDIYEIVNVQSRASKAFKEQKQESDKECVTLKEQSDTERLADALTKNKHVMAHLRGAKTEIPKIGMLHDIPFRCKADILVPGYGIFDLKTTTDLRAFRYSAKKYKYNMQSYIYCTLFGLPYDTFKFIVIDKASCDIGIYDLDESFFQSGEELLQIAIQNYNDFFGPNPVEEIHEYVIKETLFA
jgi:hypothetical protein